MRAAYLKALYEIAAKDKNVYALISDNGAIIYDQYRADFPEQYLNLGISEANILGMAAGMAYRGKIPFAYTVGAFFAYRAFEFIRNDICLQNQNVKIVGIGAGEVYSALGPTHHATEDLGGLRSLQNLTIICPATPEETYKATYAAYQHNGPVYLRLGANHLMSNINVALGMNEDKNGFQIGKAVELKSGKDITIFATGSILKDILDIADILEKDGISVRIINVHTLKPIDTEIILKAIRETGHIVTVEDHNVTGGLGSAVAEIIAESGIGVKFRRVGLTGFSCGYGTYAQVKDANGLGRKQIEEAVKNIVEERRFL